MIKNKYFFIILVFVVVFFSCSFSPQKTPLVNGDVYIINDGNVSMYIVKNEDNYIAIDAGYNSNFIKDQLINLKIDPLKVEAIFLTHCDKDHVASISLFKNAKVYFSKDEEALVKKEVYRQYTGKIPDGYLLLNDNETTTISKLSILAISTPGHTIGSMSFVVKDNLFVGDNLGLKDGKAILFYSNYNTDDNIQAESIKKLAQLKNIKYIFTGHHGYSNDFDYCFSDFKDWYCYLFSFEIDKIALLNLS